MAITYWAGGILTGLSSDTKPTNVSDGYRFYETDTLAIYLKVAGTWARAGISSVVAGDNIYLSADTEKNNASPDVYTKSKEIAVGFFGGTIRVKFDAAEATSSSGNCKARIYKNGVAFGTEQTITAVYSSFNTFTEDLVFGAGDTCELWVTAPSTLHNVYTRNFRLCAASEPYGKVRLDA